MEKEGPLLFNWIVADNAALPSNIRTLSAETMNADVVRKALSLMSFPVNVVEIRVPVDEAFKVRFKEFLTRHDLALDLLPDLGGVFKIAATVRDEINLYFDRTARMFRGDNQDLQTLLDVRDLVVDMHEAVSGVFREAVSGFMLHADGRADVIPTDETRGFHVHRGLGFDAGQIPGYYLNFNGSDVGTMFKDRAGNVWGGEGWSYFLFPTIDHPASQKLAAASHSIPLKEYGFEEQKRGTFISQMFLPPAVS
jgi:hypothetical protein